MKEIDSSSSLYCKPFPSSNSFCSSGVSMFNCGTGIPQLENKQQIISVISLFLLQVEIYKLNETLYRTLI